MKDSTWTSVVGWGLLLVGPVAKAAGLEFPDPRQETAIVLSGIFICTASILRALGK